MSGVFARGKRHYRELLHNPKETRSKSGYSRFFETEWCKSRFEGIGDNLGKMSESLIHAANGFCAVLLTTACRVSSRCSSCGFCFPFVFGAFGGMSWRWRDGIRFARVVGLFVLDVDRAEA